MWFTGGVFLCKNKVSLFLSCWLKNKVQQPNTMNTIVAPLSLLKFRFKFEWAFCSVFDKI